MKDLFDLSTALLLQQAIRGQYLGAGRLMSPPEVAAATREERVMPDAIKADWFLCGNLHPAMFKLSEKGLDKYWSQSHRMASGFGYLLFLQRAGVWEHRFLLPLFGEQMRQYIKSLATQPLRMSLAEGDFARTLIFECGGQGQSVLPSGLVVEDFPKNLPRLSVEIQRTIALLLNPAAVAAPPGSAIAEKVCVTLVMSGELLAVLESTFDALKGRSTH